MNLELFNSIELRTRTVNLLNAPFGKMPIIRYLPPKQSVKLWLYLANHRFFTWCDLFRDLVDHVAVTDVNHPANAFKSLHEAEILFGFCGSLEPAIYEQFVFDKICAASSLIDNRYLKYICSGEVSYADVCDANQQKLIRHVLSLRKQQLALFRKRLVSQYTKTGLALVAADYKRQAEYNNEVDLKATILMDCELAVIGMTNLWLEGGALNDWLTITESKASAGWLADRIYSYVKKELVK